MKYISITYWVFFTPLSGYDKTQIVNPPRQKGAALGMRKYRKQSWIITVSVDLATIKTNKPQPMQRNPENHT